MTRRLLIATLVGGALPFIGMLAVLTMKAGGSSAVAGAFLLDRLRQRPHSVFALVGWMAVFAGLGALLERLLPKQQHTRGFAILNASVKHMKDAPRLSHEKSLRVLANPSTQTILEALGYEYSVAGQAEYRKAKPNTVPALVQAIVRELERCPVFPPEFRDRLPECGLYIRRTHRNTFVVSDVDKPSVRDDYAFHSSEEAARAFIYKVLDDYWLESDRRP